MRYLVTLDVDKDVASLYQKLLVVGTLLQCLVEVIQCLVEVLHQPVRLPNPTKYAWVLGFQFQSLHHKIQTYQIKILDGLLQLTQLDASQTTVVVVLGKGLLALNRHVEVLDRQQVVLHVHVD